MGASYAPGRLGEAWPPSSVSLAEGARRPRAVLAPVVGGVMVNMATVATRAPGFGGGRLYCSHAPSHHRYVGAALEGVVLAGFWESVFLRPASGSRSSSGRLLGVGLLMAGFWESAILWLSSGRFLKSGRLPVVGLRDSRPGEGGPVLWMLEGSIGLIIS